MAMKRGKSVEMPKSQVKNTRGPNNVDPHQKAKP